MLILKEGAELLHHSLTQGLRAGVARQNVNLEAALRQEAGNGQKPVSSEGWDRRFYLHFEESEALFHTQVWKTIAECGIPFFKRLVGNSAAGVLVDPGLFVAPDMDECYRKQEIKVFHGAHPMAPMHNLYMKKRGSLRAKNPVRSPDRQKLNWD